MKGRENNMMKSEFDSLLGKTSKEKDYKIVEFVYNYHPLNFSKEGVANLYKDFGILLFKDLYERAEEARRLEEEMSKTKGKLRELEEEYRQLSE